MHLNIVQGLESNILSFIHKSKHEIATEYLCH